MGWFSNDDKKDERKRQESGRYGKKGTYRKERNGDKVGRDKDGKYKKKGWF